MVMNDKNGIKVTVIRGAGRLQEYHTEIFDDSDFHFEDDWIFDEEE